MGITLWQSLSDQVQRMARDAFKDVHSLEDWLRLRPVRHQQYMRSLGLDPLPERCDLSVKEYGSFSGEGFRARKIAFQMLDDCWSSAIVYYPESLKSTVKQGLPAVLYLCGHYPNGTDACQNHGILWARRGYVCLVLDTIEQNENPGEHHGFHKGFFNRWISLGYSAAGGETWNSLRALDVLAADVHVDASRIAVTGLSGGGSCSFLLAMLDDRIKAVSTLCGISTPVDAITNRHLMNHCDCFYPQNPYQLDISEYAALIAPRPLLFCFAQQDALFHPSEYTALYERTKKIYRLYGCEINCKLLSCVGRHADLPEFTQATQIWFDDHVSLEKHPVLKLGTREIEAENTRIFNGKSPQPNHLDLLPDLLTPQPSHVIPQNPDEWKLQKEKMIQALCVQVPAFVERDLAQHTIAPNGCWLWGAGTQMRVHRGEIQGVEVWLHAALHLDRPGKLVISIAGEGENSMHALGMISEVIDPFTVGFAAFEPRMAGFNVPASKPMNSPAGSGMPTLRTFLHVAMSIAGTSPVMMTAHDLRVLVQYLKSHDETKPFEIYLHGKGDAGVAALYAALLDERIAGVIAEGIPASHLESAPIPGVLRALDLPHAVGLLAPRKVAIVSAGHGNWNWPASVYQNIRHPDRFIKTNLLHDAMKKMFE